MFERLLVAIDETPAGEVAVSFATAIARDSGATVHVVHVNVMLLGGRGVTVETHEQAVGVLDRALRELRAAGVEASGEEFPAHILTIGSRIAGVAARTGADAIVVGSQRRRRVTRLASRGVRERVSRTTALPILVAPSPLRVGGRRGSAAAIRRMVGASERAASTR